AADVAIAREMDLTATAADVRVPTLLLCGSRDRVTPPALSRDLHAMIAGSRLEIVDGAGHMLLIEAPGVVSRAIAAFATSVSRQFSPTAGVSVATDTSVFARWRRALRRLIALVRRLNRSPAGSTSVLLMLAAAGKIRVTSVELVC